jgi:hypothetical protein
MKMGSVAERARLNERVEHLSEGIEVGSHTSSCRCVASRWMKAARERRHGQGSKAAQAVAQWSLFSESREAFADADVAEELAGFAVAGDVFGVETDDVSAGGVFHQGPADEGARADVRDVAGAEVEDGEPAFGGDDLEDAALGDYGSLCYFKFENSNPNA